MFRVDTMVSEPYHNLGTWSMHVMTHFLECFHLISNIGSSPLHSIGPCAFGKVIDKEQYSSLGLGAYRHTAPGTQGRSNSGAFYLNGKAIVLHKCKGCGEDQNWSNGNNYNELWKKKTNYCEDAPSIFQA